MNLKLIAIDIDGTLITDNSKDQNAGLTLSNLQAIQKAKDLGIKIILTTGRPFKGAQHYIKLLNLENKDSEYIITFNGSCIQTTNKNILYKQVLSKEDLKVTKKLLDNTDIKTLQINPFIQTPTAFYTTHQLINSYEKYESRKNNLTIKIRSWNEIISNIDKINPMKILFLNDESKLNILNTKIPNHIKNRFNVMRTETYSLDFINKYADKGLALSRLADKLNISSNEIMAIGNADNDIGMIKYAGIGIAVKNSTPALLKVADDITATNNNSGVAKAIEKYIFNR